MWQGYKHKNQPGIRLVFYICGDVALLGHHFFFHDDLTFIVQFAIEPKSSVP